MASASTPPASAMTPADSAADDQNYILQPPSSVSFSVSHPKLITTTPKGIRVFLQQYDQYAKEVKARALQLAVIDSTTTEPVRPVNFSYCVDPEWLESSIELEYIPGVKTMDDLTDEKLRAYLDSEAKEEKDIMTIAHIDNIIKREVSMDMTDSSSRSRMKRLFTSYVSALRRNGLSLIMKDHPKLAVKHLVSAVKPRALQQRLLTDLELAYSSHNNNVKEFMKHAMTVAEAFHIIDNGPPSNSRNSNSRAGPSRFDSKPTKENNTSSTGSASSVRSSRKSFAGRPPPLCPHPPCAENEDRHWIDDCKKCTDAEKATLKAELRAKIAARKAADGPSKSTRSQTVRANRARVKTVGRLHPPVQVSGASCSITVSDETTSMDSTGRCDDGSDDSMASPKLAESAALKGIGKISVIQTVKLSVALKKGSTDAAEQFSFSRIWTVPRTILHLASGNLALQNISFLVADDDLACEALLIGRPVLEHLRVDTNTLLDNNRFALNGSDCSTVCNPTATDSGGYVSRLMIARLNGETSDRDMQLDHSRPRVNYYSARRDEDPFPNPALLDLVDSNQHDEIRAAISDMLKTAGDNGMAPNDAERLKNWLTSTWTFSESHSHLHPQPR